MLPAFLMRAAIGVVSVVIPCYSAAHVISQRKPELPALLLYLMLYAVLSRLVLPLVEPVLRPLFALLPLDLFYEAKLAGFIFLLAPQFGTLDKLLVLLESNYEAALGKAADFADEARRQAMAQLAGAAGTAKAHFDRFAGGKAVKRA